MSRENESVVRRGVDALNRRDPAAFADLCVPDVEIVPIRAAPEETVYRGRDGVFRSFAEADTAWDELRLEDVEVRHLVERVLIFGTLHGRDRASGEALEISAGWVLQFRGGLISVARFYPSPEAALEALC